ncbi:hypothetical protein HYO11_18750 [Vibrio parahaemolyticus]|nr:hypothetical protein [Vibrio parahaemolyticus]
MTNEEINNELESLDILIKLAVDILQQAIVKQAIAHEKGDEVKFYELDFAIQVFEDRLEEHKKRRDELLNKLIGDDNE